MSETMIFRGCFIRHADIRQGKEGGTVFTRIHFSSEFSDTVRENMQWEDPGDSIRSAKLTGEMLGQNLILTPADKGLKQYELQFAISDVTDFQIVALKDDDGEPSGRQLRFIVRSAAAGVEAQISDYLRKVGRHEGQLKISYEPQAVQETLPGTQESTQEPITEHLKSEALAAHTEATGAAGSLASSAEMRHSLRQTGARAKGVQ